MQGAMSALPTRLTRPTRQTPTSRRSLLVVPLVAALIASCDSSQAPSSSAPSASPTSARAGDTASQRAAATSSVLPPAPRTTAFVHPEPPKPPDIPAPEDVAAPPPDAKK